MIFNGSQCTNYDTQLLILALILYLTSQNTCNIYEMHTQSLMMSLLIGQTYPKLKAIGFLISSKH